MKKRDKYRYGKISKQRMANVSHYLVMCAVRALNCSPIDFGVPQYGGFRDAEIQNSLYKEGYSNCDGYQNKSLHQRTDEEGKGQAIDLVPYIPKRGYCYDAGQRFGVIGMLMLESWEELKEVGEIPAHLHLHWGGLWRNKTPVSLGWDLAHYEIRDFEQKERL